MRGLTSAGRKSRGVGKSSRNNKNMPSKRASWKRRNTLSLKRYR
jgi:large subunit ribosomal protein L15e